MRLVTGWEGAVHHFSCAKQPLFPTAETNFQVKHGMSMGACRRSFRDNHFFKSIVENYLENLAENPLESPGNNLM